jgi:hypothetical protein
MGNPAQVHVIGHQETEYSHDVWLYTHWDADRIINTVSQALQREERWKDPEYLTRIIFSEMIKDNVSGSTGYGIGSHQHGDVSGIITVDADNQTVTIDGWGTPDGFYQFDDWTVFQEGVPQPSV